MPTSLKELFLARRPLLGVDLGSHAIKLVECSADHGGVAVRRVGTAATPAGAIDNGLVVEPQLVADTVRELLRATGAAPGSVASAVTDPSLVATRIPMPRTTEANLRRSIRFEARRHVPFDVDQSEIQCQILDPAGTDEQMSVLLVAVRREVVEGRVEALQAAGLTPAIVDLVQFANLRSQVYANSDPSIFDQTVGLIHLGHSFTEMTMVYRGAFVFPRIVPIAGQNMDRAIMSALNLDAEEARRLKESQAVACTREELALLPEAQRQVSQIITPVLEEIVRDIQRSLNFLASQFQFDPAKGAVDRIVLSGGTARLRNLAQYLATALNTRVEVFDIFYHTGLTAPGYDASFLAPLGPVCGVAAGLAITEIMQKGRYPVSGVPQSDAVPLPVAG